MISHPCDIFLILSSTKPAVIRFGLSDNKLMCDCIDLANNHGYKVTRMVYIPDPESIEIEVMKR